MTSNEIIMPTDDTPRGLQGAELPDALPAILAAKGLPSPRAMAQTTRDAVDNAVAAVRHDRGAVALKEDTYPLLRSLSGVLDHLGQYRRAVSGLEAHLRGYVEEEALEALGEDENARTAPRWNGAGVPAGNLTVPDGDADCDWHITRDWDSAAECDWQAIVSVQADLTARHITGGVHLVETDDGAPLDLDTRDRDPLKSADLTWGDVDLLIRSIAQVAAEDALSRVDGLRRADGKPSPRYIEAWAKELSKRGHDKLASMVSTAVHKRSAYRGVKVERA